jgi:tetratricopeptide (TPR) repeat protein
VYTFNSVTRVQVPSLPLNFKRIIALVITRLRVENFYCVEEFDEDLDPGINVFIGSSGKGKSSTAIKAPMLLGLNRPSAKRYLYDPRITGNKLWTPSPTRITLYTTEGSKIVRVRSQDENYYTLNDGEPIVGFNTNVPDIIKKALNLDVINFQLQNQRRIEDERFSQCNPLYLLSLSDSEVARALNDLAGLDDIDNAINFIGKQLRKEKDVVDINKALKEKHEANLKKYSELDSFDQCVNKAYILEDEINQKRKRLSELKTAFQDYKEKEVQLTRFKNLTQLRMVYSKIEKKLKDVSNIVLKVNELKTLVTDISRTKAARQQFLKLYLIKRDYANIVVKFATLKEKRANISELEANFKQVKEAETELLNSRAKRAETKALWETIKPETCPFCGKDMG